MSCSLHLDEGKRAKWKLKKISNWSTKREAFEVLKHEKIGPKLLTERKLEIHCLPLATRDTKKVASVRERFAQTRKKSEESCCFVV